MVAISHKHKFVFIKTVKTAGTSIECSLSKLCGDNDIFSPIFPKEVGHKARNFSSKNKQIYYNHMSALNVLNLNKTTLKDYFFWCVERHPIDKCLSHYAMISNSKSHSTNETKDLSWDEYVQRKNFPNDIDKYSFLDKNKGRVPLVNKIIDYKNLDLELNKLFSKLFGIDNFELTYFAKSGFRNKKNVPNIKEVSSYQKQIIMNNYSDCIEFLKIFGINYT